MSEPSKAMSRKEKIELQTRLRKQKISRIIGMALASVFLIISIVFIVFLMKLGMLPEKYLLALVVVLMLILMYVFISQFTKTHIFGKVLAVLFSVLLGVGCWYIRTAQITIGDISKNDTIQVDNISIIVLADNPAGAIDDTGAYLFGRNGVLDIAMTDDTISSLNTKLNTTIQVQSFDTWSDVVGALYDRSVDAIIFNESYRSTIEEEHLNFSKETKVLESKKFTSTIVLDTANKELVEEPFVMFLSGNDTNGNLAAANRSDVNMIAAINPNTKTILLVTIPRDSYVTLISANGTPSPGYDKLTHAGNGGVASSINTVSKMFDLDIDYYLRLNFTGIINLVDALGGITVYSDYSFTTYDTTHSFVKGENKMDGVDAMYFARERFAFQNGDFQRNKNQVKVIEAIIAKACSSKILTNYHAIMNSLTGVLETNVPEEQISKLVKMQLNDMSAWNIISAGITGSTGLADCYGHGSLSVVFVDDSTVTEAKAKIEQVLEGTLTK